MADLDTGADAAKIFNPIYWCYAEHEDAEWWHRGGESREQAIAGGTTHFDGRPFWIAQASRMLPSFAIFDGDDLCERLGEDECWGEDGWEGEPGNEAKSELEKRLEATFRQWFADLANLAGASLDELSSELITPAVDEVQA